MGRHSKIDKLPDDLKAQLERLLASRQHEGYRALSEWLKGQGFEISFSAVHRFDERLRHVMDRIRASTEAARLITAATPDDEDEHSAAVLKMVQSSLFEAMTSIAHAGEADMDSAQRIKVLSTAARAVAEASRASIGQKKWAQELRGKVEAVLAEEARTGGISEATQQRIRAAVGIA